MRRALIQVHVVHTPEDMGSLAQRLSVDKTHSQLAEARWSNIREQVQALSVNWSEVKVYQDGLPDAEPEIIRRVLTEVHSANYDLLRWLIAQGAEVIGTESPALMTEEYAHLRAVVTAKDAATKARARQAYVECAAALLAKRDAYIARRIAETLSPDGLGLLFIGQAHDVAKHLPSDIKVREIPFSRVTAAAEDAQNTETLDEIHGDNDVSDE